MKVIIVENYDEMSKKAAEIMIDLVKNNPNAVLGLATGSSPIGMYQYMAIGLEPVARPSTALGLFFTNSIMISAAFLLISS